MYLKSYKELIVWQKSMDLVVLVFDLTKNYPREEIFGMVSQMRRASVGIPSNIAEGYGRKTRKEFRQFVTIAYGSALELETQLMLSRRLEFTTVKDYEKANALLQEVLKMLNSMISKLKLLDAKR